MRRRSTWCGVRAATGGGCGELVPSVAGASVVSEAAGREFVAAARNGSGTSRSGSPGRGCGLDGRLVVRLAAGCGWPPGGVVRLAAARGHGVGGWGQEQEALTMLVGAGAGGLDHGGWGQEELLVLGHGWRWLTVASPRCGVSVFCNDLVTMMRWCDGGGVSLHELLGRISVGWAGDARRVCRHLSPCQDCLRAKALVRCCTGDGGVSGRYSVGNICLEAWFQGFVLWFFGAVR